MLRLFPVVGNPIFHYGSQSFSIRKVWENIEYSEKKTLPLIIIYKYYFNPRNPGGRADSAPTSIIVIKQNNALKRRAWGICKFTNVHPGRFATNFKSIGYPVKIWEVFPREGSPNLLLRMDQNLEDPKMLKVIKTESMHIHKFVHVSWTPYETFDY